MTLSPAPDCGIASNKDNFYGCANCVCANDINSGRYAYNNLQQYDATWYHKFSAKWHRATESWYMSEHEVPDVTGNMAHTVPTETGANGAYCKAGEVTCTGKAPCRIAGVFNH